MAFALCRSAYIQISHCDRPKYTWAAIHVNLKLGQRIFCKKILSRFTNK